MRKLLFVAAVLVSACGGEVVDPPAAPAASAASQETPSGGKSESTSGTSDVAADSSDACSIARPGEAKALPAGITVPSGAAGLRLEFELKDQRVELVGIRERGVAPAWTTKNTQIFAPETTSGDWIETRDATGTLTFQGGIYDPLSRTIEAAPDPNDPNSEWKNTEVCSKTSTFHVEIPGDAVEVRFYANELSSRPTALYAWYRLR